MIRERNGSSKTKERLRETEDGGEGGKKVWVKRDEEEVKPRSRSNKLAEVTWRKQKEVSRDKGQEAENFHDRFIDRT